MARSHFTFEKRRKELDKKKKKEAKREARAERKAAGDSTGAPIVEIDEWGNPIEPETPEVADEADEDVDGDAEAKREDEA